MSANQGADTGPELTIILAGGTGVFGRHVTRALTGAGHRVMSLGRGAGNDIVADILDRNALLRAVDGRHADAVVHAATALRKPPIRHRDMYPTDDLRTAGTTNLVAAARVVGAHRFVAENMVFGYGYGDLGDRPLTEDAPFGRPHPDPAFDRHLAGMRAKEDLIFDVPELAGVSLRFGLFYGPGGATEAILDMLRGRRIPVIPDDGRVVPWVHLADAADAVLAAVERGRPGAAYNIADGSRVGFNEAMVRTAAAFGLPRPPRVPGWLFGAVPYARAVMRMNLRVSTERAARELGWRPRFRTLDEGLRAMAAARVGAAR
ncbi:NAD-dependent epimerase/dehydratase family protein [Plantactinospora siamensis]|uniref:NAD-dependent epimerase/dehydratase family protein n=1 Tax=Plantactinospora siamensis TaxID=555372 RepID=A0ABV6P0G4_9ACTN